MSVPRVPIPKQPGYWRRGDRVVFKYRDHRRKQRWGSGRTIAEAKRRKAELETDVNRGEFRDRVGVTFGDYARSWVETYVGRTRNGLSEQTRDDYRKRLEQDAIPYLGAMRLQEITPIDVKALASDVAGRGVKPNTVRLALAPVKALFATAFEEGTIRLNPAAGVRIAQPRPQFDDVGESDEVKALTPLELARLLRRIPDSWQLFFSVLANLGIRIGEAIELRWRDVDLGAGTVRIERTWYLGRVGRPKSRFGRRTLRLTPELSTALWELRKQTRGAAGDLVFTAARGGRIDQSNLMSRVLKKAAEPIELDWVGFHTFRHTCATTLFRKGWNPVQVQRWLGHHKPSFTIDTYVHLLDHDTPDPVAISRRGTRGGTQRTREGANMATAEAAEIRAAEPDRPASAMQAKSAATNS